MVIPIIMSMDKTQLTTFHDKIVYPIYLTIGNIPKQIQEKVSHYAYMLIGYILTTKLTGISSKAAWHHALINLFHTCMQTVLGPIDPYGKIEMDMMSSDGV